MATGIYLIDHPPVTRQFRSPRRAEPSGLVVVHTAEAFADESPPDRGAENVAAFIARRTNPGSYHDLADSDSIIQLVRYSDEAFHDATGSNPHSYGVSAAAQAAEWDDYSQAWRNATVTNMARAAARYALWLKARNGIRIPAQRVTREQSEDRVPGFISHAARDPDRRTDPGRSFPWTFFLSQYARLIQTPIITPLKGRKPMFVTRYGSTVYVAFFTDVGKGVRISEAGYNEFRRMGIPAGALPNADVVAILAAFDQAELVDIVGDGVGDA